MPNIMLTYRCNLRCPYCFANEFVNGDSTDITDENFQTATDFILNSGINYIGLIGGEPLLHPHFSQFMEKLINDSRLSSITVYTNGLKMDRFFNELSAPKVKLLVNCNSPENMGKEAFEKLQKNLDELVFRRYMKPRINLGVNLYRDDLDYGYLFELLKRYGYHRLRISLTVPNLEEKKNQDALAYFRQRKPFLMDFFRRLDECAVVPYYDCNKIPYCVFDEDDLLQIRNILDKYHVRKTNLTGNQAYCKPVIDILPDLRAVRCFGLSDYHKVSIRDFRSLEDIRRYFSRMIDYKASHIANDSRCSQCYEFLTDQCTGGCIAFKQSRLRDSESK